MLKIAGYTVLETLHESQNSIVYRSENGQTQQPVILKMLRDAYPSPEKVAWFQQEFDLTRQLDLAGVPRAYELKKEQNRWLMVLEDFGGESLARMKLAGTISLPRFLDLALKTVDILGQIHQRQIVHKDLTPNNILLNVRTQTVKITDFGISTVLSHEAITFRPPNSLEGTLAYISPEQTGRMNRTVDYRTDFYSLGVTLYELLTGQLPFSSPDALELVHSHLAKQPLPPHQINPSIPPILSQIILKLMAKSADNRYQSAYGLKFDLQRCLDEIDHLADLDFVLAHHQQSGRFQIPQKLYGREAELKQLLRGFEKVCGGATQLMMVAGYSGIGKSALVQELYQPVTAAQGYFIAGKFDQFQRNIPYSALIQAFRSLMRQLLTESDADLATWREALRAALGSNGKVMTEVIPELELLIGPQPEPAVLGPTETQNRFNLVFLNFIHLFTQPEHPLVIFLDDLQWTDRATLTLLQQLMTDPDSQYLLIIGAYRDNEVPLSHPLRLTLADIETAENLMQSITLKGLDSSHVKQLIADTLHRPSAEVDELAALVQRKTAGNPFFVNQFLTTLYEEKRFSFETTTGRWQWELSQIEQQQMTDNVVELMAQKLQRLPPETQTLLQLAACIGNQFSLNMLAVVSQKSLPQTAQALWPALAEMFIQPLDGRYKLAENNQEIGGLVSYKFLHDRVQQAAYALIDEAAKQTVHHKIGQLMLFDTPEDEREERIFEIVNQFNVSLDLLTEEADRVQLAELNLLAGRKARASIAYDSARNYLQMGLSLLPDDSWQRQYQLTYDLHWAHSEAAYLQADFAAAEQEFTLMLTHAQTVIEKAQVYILWNDFHLTQGNYETCLDITREGLMLFEIALPTLDQPIDLGSELAQLNDNLAGRQPHELLDLPEMNKEMALAVLLLVRVLPPAYFISQALFSWINCRIVNLSLLHGNSNYSAYGYVGYAVILCVGMQQYELGQRFGQLAFDLEKKLNDFSLHQATLVMVGNFVNHWREHLEKSVKFLRQAYKIGVENGDLIYAGYGGNVTIFYRLLIGHPLADIYAESETYLDFIRRAKDEDTAGNVVVSQAMIKGMQGQAETAWGFGTPEDGDDRLLAYLNNLTMKLPLFWYSVLKLRTLYLFEQYQAAKAIIDQGQPLTAYAMGFMIVPEFYFFHALTLVVWYDQSSDDDEKENLWEALTSQQAQMRIWADNAPSNFEHKYRLVAAEMARVADQNMGETLALYDQAIAAAAEARYIQNEALANELAAKYLLAQGHLKAAQPYLQDARYGYLQWGATAKVTHLDQCYPHLLQFEPRKRASPTTSGSGSPTKSPPSSSGGSFSLDLNSVLKASQAISGEIKLETLLSQLIQIIIENAGAERGLLILPRQEQWVIEAEATSDTSQPPQLRQALPLDTERQGQPILAQTVVTYVIRTQKNVVLGDAAHDSRFAKDGYILQQQPKSILCTPLLHQGNVAGVIYLENNLTPETFTPDRIELLNLLASQAAISLENATLYDQQVRLTESYSRFVPLEYLTFLQKKHITQVQLGDHVSKEMAILFSDIRDFTTLSESMTPQENFDFVNGYLQLVSPKIREHQGIIIKYLGDGMMAVFPNSVDDALQAALAQSNQVERFNQERQPAGLEPISIGIGIHMGSMMVGMVGEESRMQGDAFSDNVNLTARLEGLTRFYGVSLVISEYAYNHLSDPTAYQVRFLDRVVVKGRTESIAIFELLDGLPPAERTLKQASQPLFEQGLVFYQGGEFAQARQQFEQVLMDNPADKPAALYLQRIDQLLQQGVPSDWDGIWQLAEK